MPGDHCGSYFLKGHGKVIVKTFPSQSGLDLRGLLGIVPFGGAGETRTPDLLRAREALSQLSYSPTSATKKGNLGRVLVSQQRFAFWILALLT
jgi:hypothetical protein